MENRYFEILSHLSGTPLTFFHSRVYPLRAYPFFIKREDELSFGQSGTKKRKIEALLNTLRVRGFTKVYAYGSAYSNHLLALAQSCKEKGIDYYFFIKKPHLLKNQGNWKYLSLLLTNQEYEFVSEIPACFPSSRTTSQTPPFFYIREGGDCVEALAGAMTLSYDIVKNESEIGVPFQEIILDAGTGISAIGCILGFALLEKKRRIHVFSMYPSAEVFFQSLNSYKGYVEKTYNFTFPSCIDTHLHTLSHAKSFGSVSKSVLKTISDFAKKEGVFLDPFYTGKTVHEITSSCKQFASPTLFVHSGGALSLSGFYN